MPLFLLQSHARCLLNYNLTQAAGVGNAVGMGYVYEEDF